MGRVRAALLAIGVMIAVVAPAAPAAAAVPAPATLSATAGDSTVNLTWSRADSPEIARYVAYQWMPASKSWRQVAATPATETSATITGLTNGTLYYFVVLARTSNAQSPASPRASARPMPLEPTTDDPDGPTVQHCGSLAKDEVWRGSHVLSCTTTIPDGIKLSIGPGTVVAAQPGQSLVVAGTLHVAGTSDAPVDLTTTRAMLTEHGDGAAPAKGAWRGVTVDGTGAVVHLDGVRLEYGTNCLAVVRAAEVRVSGRVANCVNGVSSGTYVGARNVDWGSPSGPAPFGSGASITSLTVGAVPWRGYVDPAVPRDVAPQPQPFDSRCVDLVMYGVRGAGEQPRPADGAEDATYSTDREGFGGLTWGASYWQWSKVANARPGTTVRVVAIRYPAFPVPSRSSDWPRFVRGMLTGAVRLRQVIDDELGRCPNTQVTIAGVSQGAIVAHLYLNGVAGSVPFDHIAAVTLIGDPTRPGSSPETTWTAAGAAAPSSVSESSGIWSGFVGATAVPGGIADRALSWCREDDLICTARPGATLAGHARYSIEDTKAVGTWMAEKALPRLPQRRPAR